MIAASMAVHDVIDEASVSLLVTHEKKSNSEVLVSSLVSALRSTGLDGRCILRIVGIEVADVGECFNVLGTHSGNTTDMFKDF